jgi:hypothetical protein
LLVLPEQIINSYYPSYAPSLADEFLAHTYFLVSSVVAYLYFHFIQEGVSSSPLKHTIATIAWLFLFFRVATGQELAHPIAAFAISTFYVVNSIQRAHILQTPVSFKLFSNNLSTAQNWARLYTLVATVIFGLLMIITPNMWASTHGFPALSPTAINVSIWCGVAHILLAIFCHDVDDANTLRNLHLLSAALIVSWMVRIANIANGSLYFALATHVALAAIHHGVLDRK